MLVERWAADTCVLELVGHLVHVLPKLAKALLWLLLRLRELAKGRLGHLLTAPSVLLTETRSLWGKTSTLWAKLRLLLWCKTSTLLWHAKAGLRGLIETLVERWWGRDVLAKGALRLESLAETGLRHSWSRHLACHLAWHWASHLRLRSRSLGWN